MWLSGPGIGKLLMYGTEQDLIGMIEDPLCTIPMMAVNIQDENLFSLIGKLLLFYTSSISQA